MPVKCSILLTCSSSFEKLDREKTLRNGDFIKSVWRQNPLFIAIDSIELIDKFKILPFGKCAWKSRNLNEKILFAFQTLYLR